MVDRKPGERQRGESAADTSVHTLPPASTRFSILLQKSSWIEASRHEAGSGQRSGFHLVGLSMISLGENLSPQL